MYNVIIGLKLIYIDIVEILDIFCLFKDVEIDISIFIKRICGRGVRSKWFFFFLIVFLILLMLFIRIFFMNFININKLLSLVILNFIKILGILFENVFCYFKYFLVCCFKGGIGYWL